MIRNLLIISNHSQIRELGSSLKYNMLKELINGAVTCQQLANIFSLSKQKVHYNLTKLLEEGLIEIVDDHLPNNKEVYYRAVAKNFVLDFSIGFNVSENILNNREIIHTILEQEYRVSLQDIASKLLDHSLRIQPKEKILIVTGKYNLPLVEKILLEAARRSIRVTLLYQDVDLLRAKYNEYSLAAFNADYEYFNSLLQSHDVYLNLNGEARYEQITDPAKIKLRQKHFEKSRKIINQNKVRVAVMPGLLRDTLSESSIVTELQFWQALDIDYEKQCQQTVELCSTFENQRHLYINKDHTSFRFEIDKILSECGSFSGSKYQSPVINLPGGEILLVPKAKSMNGIIHAEIAYIFGEKILKPVIEIKNNEIVTFSAQTNSHLIARAIKEGGIDGNKVALICLGTNENIKLESIDLSYKHKSSGLMTVYWGENKSLGGNVTGSTEWFVQIEKPTIDHS